MKILILGATGPTGRLIVDRALESGDVVTVLVRNAASLGIPTERVTVVVGDATSSADLASAMNGHDAVISALGRGKSIRAHDLFTDAADAVIAASQATGVKRLVWMSSFGVGDTYRDANPVQKVMYSTFLRDIYANKHEAERALRASDLDWTVVYPSALTNGPATSDYRVGDHVEMKLAARVSRADVADFMAKAAHDPDWIRRDAVITG